MESGLSGANGDEGDGLVDSSERGHIDSLSSDGTLGTNSGRVLSGTGVDDSVDKNLDGVLVGEEVDDLEGVGNDSDSHELLTVVSAVHHQAVRKQWKIEMEQYTNKSRQFSVYRKYLPFQINLDAGSRKLTS